MKIPSTFFYLLVISCFVLITGLALPAQASHIVGGEITYLSDTTNTSSLRYFFKLIIYSDNRSTADVALAGLDFGDGSSKTVARTMKVKTSDSTISRNTYYFDHVYAGTGTFLVSFKEIYRGGGYLNIPNSAGNAFAIQATVQISSLATPNRSPVFQAPLIIQAPYNEVYRHNPAAYDADSDSLGFKLVSCFKDAATPIPDYQFPENITLNTRSGEITWNRPQQLGTYAFAYEVTEYRQGQVIGKVMRDYIVIIVTAKQGNLDVVIQNRNELPITDNNQIFIAPLTPVTIKVLATNAAAVDVYSPLFGLSKNVSKQVSSTGSNILYEFSITPEESLRRSLPYLITFRAIAPDNTTKKDLSVLLYLRPQRNGDNENTDVLGLPGAEDETTAGNFQVYPNPVVERYFTVDNKLGTPAYLQLYKPNGQLVLEQPVKLKRNKILPNNLGAGIYFYIIRSKKQEVQQRGKLVWY